MSATDPSRPITLDAMAQGVRRLFASRATGALAELRRLDVDCPIAAAFHALLAEAAPDNLLAGDDLDLDAKTRRLARVAQVMALKPDGLARKPLGAALQAIDYPEGRLAMLLNAKGPTLDDLVRRAARRIALSDEPMPYRDLGRLLVLAGRFERQKALDDLRISIARDYQRAAHKTAANSDKASAT
jgi:hypothetical protein